MSEFGAHLKQARESRGISLRQIAMATKISTVALESLERGDLRKLPGGIFSRAFVRAYAIEVGLDPDEVVAEFLKAQGIEASKAKEEESVQYISADDRAFLEQQRRAAIALRVAIAVVVVLIVAAVAWWQMTRTAAPEVTPTPEPPVAATTPPPAAPVPIATTADADAPVRIELTATDNCWVQVTVDGTLQPARVLAPGERERVDAQREVVLQVGSAGAITWTVNGEPGRALGRPGEVRSVTVTPETVSVFQREAGQDGRPTPTASATDRP